MLTIRREVFTSEKLIFIPTSETRSPSDWIGMSECVWSGPKCLRKTPCLQDFYPGQLRFFCFTLGISQADWKTLMHEAQGIEAFDDIDYISDVFISISENLQHTPSSNRAKASHGVSKALLDAEIFPISKRKSMATFDYLSNGNQSELWFIADRWHLKENFEGLVPLLALKVEAIEKVSALISALGLEYRLLSKLTHGVPEASGNIRFDAQYTNSIWTKARYMSRLGQRLRVASPTG